VQNYSKSARRYDVSNAFRYANDAASGAVKILTPGSVYVAPFSSATFDVVMKIDAAKLPTWELFGGWNTGLGSLLQTVEFDGYLTLKDSRDTVRLPWHVLPHKSANVEVINNNVIIPKKGFGLLAMANLSKVLAGGFDLFYLTGTSPRLRRSQLPDADETTVHDLAAVGVRLNYDAGEPVVQFAINTYGRRAHPAYPGRFDVLIDVDNDGTFDFNVFNAENGDFDTTGETLVAIDDLSIPGLDDAAAYYYADVDLDSGNLIMTAPLFALGGLTIDQKFRFDVEAHDNYFASTMADGLTDAIRKNVYTLNTPKFDVAPGSVPEGGVPPRSGLLLKVNALPGGDKASPSQQGFLFMYRDAADEAETVTVHKLGK
jgi:hypothetical protein